MRGLDWAVLPTTLLSMVDASLGGKTGFDLPEGVPSHPALAGAVCGTFLLSTFFAAIGLTRKTGSSLQWLV